MKLKITSFADAGVHGKERLVMQADADIELGEYAVFITELTDEGVATAGRQTAYWFPDGRIKKNDLVVLYSKAGRPGTKDLKEGRTAHFFYWGHDQSIWDKDKRGAVVLRASEWSTGIPD